MEEADYRKINELCVGTAEKTHEGRHKAKLERLLMKKGGVKRGVSLRPEGLGRWVVNLSKKEIISEQEEVLSLGLKFTPAPTKLHLLDMAAAIEVVAKRMDEDEANDLRGRVCGIMRRSKLPRDNLSADQLAEGT